MERDLNEIASNILRKIESSSKFLILASKPVDYDSLGTALSVRWWLNKLNKKLVDTVLFGEIPEHIKNFPDINLIEQKYINEVDFNNYEAIILVDGNEFRQFLTNDYKKVLKELNQERFISIDHHTPGYIEELIPEMTLRKQDSCTSKVFYDFFIKDSKIEIDSTVGMYMYKALVGDTGTFNYQIYPDTFSFAQKLIEAGVDHDEAVDLSIPKNMMDFTAWGIQQTEYFPDEKSMILVVDDNKKKLLAEIFGEDWEKYDLFRYYNNVVMRMVTGFPYSIVLSTTADSGITKLSYRVKNFGVEFNLMDVLNSNGFNVKGHVKAGSGMINLNLEEAKKKYLEIVGGLLTS